MQNDGHGMLFRAFDGQLMLVIHQPERLCYERIVFLKSRVYSFRKSDINQKARKIFD
jgi:hypothetical protein